jgi:acyl-CoA dehydrogenase
MFIMMNLARFSVGMEGVGIGERAYQRAVAFARERVQGRPVGTAPAAAMPAIIEHPDVRRMLMTMRASTEAMRAVAYVTAAALDNARRNPDAGARAAHLAFAEFMVPIVKGWSTETAQRVANLGLQVHGGMGFIEETGAAQHVRDARIITIYEGTTAIQANDFVGRKTARDQGAVASRVLDEVGKTALALKAHGNAALVAMGERLEAAAESAKSALAWLLRSYASNPRDAFAGSVPYLELWGHLCGGWQMGRAALVAEAKLTAGDGDPDFWRVKLLTSGYYAEAMLPRVEALAEEAMHGGENALALAAAQF